MSGPHESGKTTTLKQVIANSSSGVLYVSVDEDVSINLYSALTIDLHCDSYWSSFLKSMGIQLKVCSDNS